MSLSGFTVPAPGAKKQPRPFQLLAGTLLRPEANGRVDQKEINAIVDQLNPGRAYWSRLETPFTPTMVALAATGTDEASQTQQRHEAIVREWAATLERVAWEAFREATGSLGTTARALKAIAIAERAFSYRLYALLKPYRSIGKEAEDGNAARP